MRTRKVIKLPYIGETSHVSKNIVMVQNSTKKKLHEGTKLYKDKQAQRISIAQRKFARGDKIAPRVNFAGVTILQGDIFAH